MSNFGGRYTIGASGRPEHPLFSGQNNSGLEPGLTGTGLNTGDNPGHRRRSVPSGTDPGNVARMQSGQNESPGTPNTPSEVIQSRLEGPSGSSIEQHKPLEPISREDVGRFMTQIRTGRELMIANVLLRHQNADPGSSGLMVGDIRSNLRRDMNLSTTGQDDPVLGKHSTFYLLCKSLASRGDVIQTTEVNGIAHFGIAERYRKPLTRYIQDTILLSSQTELIDVLTAGTTLRPENDDPLPLRTQLAGVFSNRLITPDGKPTYEVVTIDEMINHIFPSEPEENRPKRYIYLREQFRKLSEEGFGTLLLRKENQPVNWFRLSDNPPKDSVIPSQEVLQSLSSKKGKGKFTDTFFTHLNEAMRSLKEESAIRMYSSKEFYGRLTELFPQYRQSNPVTEMRFIYDAISPALQELAKPEYNFLDYYHVVPGITATEEHAPFLIGVRNYTNGFNSSSTQESGEFMKSFMNNPEAQQDFWIESRRFNPESERSSYDEFSNHIVQQLQVSPDGLYTTEIADLLGRGAGYTAITLRRMGFQYQLIRSLEGKEYVWKIPDHPAEQLQLKYLRSSIDGGVAQMIQKGGKTQFAVYEKGSPEYKGIVDDGTQAYIDYQHEPVLLDPRDRYHRQGQVMNFIIKGQNTLTFDVDPESHEVVSSSYPNYAALLSIMSKAFDNELGKIKQPFSQTRAQSEYSFKDLVFRLSALGQLDAVLPVSRPIEKRRAEFLNLAVEWYVKTHFGLISPELSTKQSNAVGQEQIIPDTQPSPEVQPPVKEQLTPVEVQAIQKLASEEKETSKESITRQLVIEYKVGKVSFEAILENNYDIIKRITSLYGGGDDLEQVAALALWDAVNKYKEQRGKWRAFAAIKILTQVKREAFKSPSVRPAINIIDYYKKARNFLIAQDLDIGDKNTEAILIKQIKIPQNLINSVMEVLRSGMPDVLSLQETLGNPDEESNGTREDIIAAQTLDVQSQTETAVVLENIFSPGYFMTNFSEEQREELIQEFESSQEFIQSPIFNTLTDRQKLFLFKKYVLGMGLNEIASEGGFKSKQLVDKDIMIAIEKLRKGF